MKRKAMVVSKVGLLRWTEVPPLSMRPLWSGTWQIREGAGAPTARAHPEARCQQKRTGSGSQAPLRTDGSRQLAIAPIGLVMAAPITILLRTPAVPLWKDHHRRSSEPVRRDYRQSRSSARSGSGWHGGALLHASLYGDDDASCPPLSCAFSLCGCWLSLHRGDRRA